MQRGATGFWNWHRSNLKDKIYVKIFQTGKPEILDRFSLRTSTIHARNAASTKEKEKAVSRGWGYSIPSFF